MVRRQTARELLVDSFKELGRAHPLSEVTVQRIAENAGLSKRTFYNYFADKYDLITWLFESNAEAAYALLAEGESYRDFLLHVLDMFLDDAALYTNILRNATGFDSYVHMLCRANMRMVNRLLAERGVELTERDRFTIKFALDAGVYAAAEWVESGMVLDKEVFATWVSESLPAQVENILFVNDL